MILDLFIVYKSGLKFCSAQVSNLSANPGKVHLEGLVHLLRYIRDNKTLVLKYYADLNDAPVTDLLRKPILRPRTTWWIFLILVGRIVHKLEEVQEHI